MKVLMVTNMYPSPERQGWGSFIKTQVESLRAAGIKSVAAIGDAFAPATIAHAVHAGHRYARELDASLPAGVPFGRELPAAS